MLGIRKLLTVAAMITVSTFAPEIAPADQSNLPEPYEAYYTIQRDSIDATRKFVLSQKGDVYRTFSEIKARGIASVMQSEPARELGRFRIIDNNIRPLTYWLAVDQTYLVVKLIQQQNGKTILTSELSSLN